MSMLKMEEIANRKRCQFQFRHRLEKKLHNVLEGKTELLFEFKEINDDQANIIINILHDRLSISGHYFEHMWFVDEQNVLCEGNIISVKCSSKFNIAKITAPYWNPGEFEGDDTTMTIGRFHYQQFVHR